MAEKPKRPDPLAELYSEYVDRLRGDRWHPAVDVFETEEQLMVRIELAGVRTEDLRVTADGDGIYVRGIRRTPAEIEVQRLHQMEIAFGPFERFVQLRVPFDADGITARLQDGFLEVVLPKKQSQGQRIEIE